MTELVERGEERHSQAELTVREGECPLSYPLAVVSQTQSQAAAESLDWPAEQYSGDTHQLVPSVVL